MILLSSLDGFFANDYLWKYLLINGEICGWEAGLTRLPISTIGSLARAMFVNTGDDWCQWQNINIHYSERGGVTRMDSHGGESVKTLLQYFSRDFNAEYLSAICFTVLLFIIITRWDIINYIYNIYPDNCTSNMGYATGGVLSDWTCNICCNSKW